MEPIGQGKSELQPAGHPPRRARRCLFPGWKFPLLLTLLATPVAYSIFDDVANSGIWRRVRGLGEAVRQRAAAAVSSILGTTGR